MILKKRPKVENRELKDPEEFKKFHKSEEDYSLCPPAGFGVRLLALGLDGLILAIINQTVTILAIYTHLGREGNFGDFEKIPPHFQMIAVFLSTLISFLIIIRPLKKKGQTPGKRVLKIKVVRENFDIDLSWGQVIFREWVFKSVSFLLFFISLPMVMFRKDKRVLHDVICGTQVVRVKENEHL
tara:strand:- start:4030 stop:4581 length:552 start_codon:yes stop_codon:yes gene_type:complete